MIFASYSSEFIVNLFCFSAIVGTVKKYRLLLTPWDYYYGSKKTKKAAAAQKEEGVGGPMDEVCPRGIRI